MATLRPTTRLVSRHLTRISTLSTSTSTSFLSKPTNNTTAFPPHPFLCQRSTCKSNLHTFPALHRQDPTSNVANPVPKGDANATTYAEGTPGEPKPGETLSSGISPSTLYTFTDIKSISTHPESYPDKVLIDVREPSELLSTGRIPSALNIPISSAPDAFFLGEEDFEDKYGFERPGEDKEVIFYCKAGVRSRAAARLAGQAGFGGKQGEFPGSWVEWEANGGEIQKE